MTILPIYVAPHPVLKAVAKPVEAVDDKLRRFMDDMLDTMYENHGIGLAAPQVGISKRIIVIDIEQNHDAEKIKDRKGKPCYFINPEIVWASEECRTYNEGCLSLPDQYADVDRPKQIKVKFLDYKGNEQQIDADGLLATVIQHEMDHLEGILFVDHLSKLKREMVMKKLKKYVKSNKEDMDESHVIL